MSQEPPAGAVLALESTVAAHEQKLPAQHSSDVNDAHFLWPHYAPPMAAPPSPFQHRAYSGFYQVPEAIPELRYGLASPPEPAYYGYASAPPLAPNYSAVVSPIYSYPPTPQNLLMPFLPPLVVPDIDCFATQQNCYLPNRVSKGFPTSIYPPAVQPTAFGYGRPASMPPYPMLPGLSSYFSASSLALGFKASASSSSPYASATSNASPHGSSDFHQSYAETEDGLSTAPGEVPMITSVGNPLKGRNANANAKKTDKRIARDALVNCQICYKPFAKLIKRGINSELNQDHSFAFTCNGCCINESSPDTLAFNTQAISTGTSKRGRANDQSNSKAKCDVCHNVVGRGGCIMTDSAVEQLFTVELICRASFRKLKPPLMVTDHCSLTYQRCTNCGAGGAARLCVGKWRAKELFPSGRKTCSLPHYRPSAMIDLENVVFKTAELRAEEVGRFSELCMKVFEQNVLSNFAIPEVMESAEAEGPYIFSTFAQIKGMANTSWDRMSVFLTGHPFVESATRYIAVKWFQPQPRKANKSAMPVDALPKTPSLSGLDRPGKDFIAFGLSEYDHINGCLFVPCLAPWTSHDGFEPTIDLLEDLLDYIDLEVEQRISKFYAEGGNISQAPQTPRVTHVFTMVPYSRDTRIRNYMEKKRAFVPLDKYLERHPDASPQMFPPHRPVHIPVPMQKAFFVLAKGYVPERDKRGSKARRSQPSI